MNKAVVLLLVLQSAYQIALACPTCHFQSRVTQGDSNLEFRLPPRLVISGRLNLITWDLNLPLRALVHSVLDVHVLKARHVFFE